MLWFRHKKTTSDTLHQQADEVESLISAHRNVRNKAVEEANEVNTRLKQLLSANGFTLKIYLAAGGHRPKST